MVLELIELACTAAAPGALGARQTGYCKGERGLRRVCSVSGRSQSVLVNQPAPFGHESDGTHASHRLRTISQASLGVSRADFQLNQFTSDAGHRRFTGALRESPPPLLASYNADGLLKP